MFAAVPPDLFDMARLQLETPSAYLFKTHISVRIDDLNYGNHLSNDTYLKYMQEARMQFFNHLGLSEMNIGGCSVIMGEAGIRFLQECFYGDHLLIEVTALNLGIKSFDLYYRFTKTADQSEVCLAKTAMVCYDYETHKSVPIPDSFRLLMSQQAG